jgi:hypothetical protein
MVKMGYGEQMNKNYLIILSIIVIMAISACGPAPEPTLTAQQISDTAVANAWIAITQTQAAIPTATATAVPTATFTPPPTFTFVPTVPPATIAVNDPAAATTTDPCNQPPIDKPQGAQVKVKFVNKSDGIVNLAFGMNSPNSKKECVTYSYTLGVFEESVVTVLAGCYWGYAWITGDKPSVARTGSTILCVDDPNKTPPIWITKETIYFH